MKITWEEPCWREEGWPAFLRRDRDMVREVATSNVDDDHFYLFDLTRTASKLTPVALKAETFIYEKTYHLTGRHPPNMHLCYADVHTYRGIKT